MSKQPSIRWRKRDKQEIRREVKNFNARMAYARRNNPGAVDIPENVRLNDLLSGITTRADYNRIIGALRGTKYTPPTPAPQPGIYQPTREEKTRLKKTVKNFNARVDTAVKRNPENAGLMPQKKTVKGILSKVGTADELRETVDSLERFNAESSSVVKSKRGAKATQWEIDEFKRKEAIVNAQRQKDRDRINAEEIKIGGVGQGSTRAQMGSIRDNALKTTNKNFDNLSMKEWEKAVGTIEHALDKGARAERLARMRENYLKGLRDSNFLDNDPELEELIDSVDDDEFLLTSETDVTASFVFYRSPNDFQIRADNIRASWEAAAERSRQKKQM